jgi:hypothetical protein
MSTQEEEQGEKRGPAGGIKHQPGRGHDRKSTRAKKKRFASKAAKKRQEQEEEAKRVWAEWDALPAQAKKLLGPTSEPKMPRPEGME